MVEKMAYDAYERNVNLGLCKGSEQSTLMPRLRQSPDCCSMSKGSPEPRPTKNDRNRKNMNEYIFLLRPLDLP